MSMAIFWAVLAGAAIVAELMTGTLYLLVLGASAAAACLLAATTNASVAVQLAVFSILCVPSMMALRKHRKNQPPAKLMAADVGQQVEILFVREDGSYRVRYSGTEWDAVSVDSPAPGENPKWLVIVGTHGNLLKCKSAPAPVVQ